MSSVPILDRSHAPAPGAIANPTLTPVQQLTLDNGVPVYIIEGGTQEVTRIEFAFEAGTWHSNQKLMAGTANAMLTEGTSELNGPELSARLDGYGAFIQNEASRDVASIALYTLNRFWQETLPVFESMIKDSKVPQTALDIYLNNRRQSHLVGQEKVGVLARQAFSGQLFGEDHPYGQQVDLEDYDAVSRAVVMEFYQKRYTARQASLFIAGKPPKALIAALNHHFGGADWIGEHSAPFEYRLPDPQQALSIEVNKSGALQSAIRLGRRLFSKNHPDYFPLQVTNTLLGGYFGSRLMTNLREDKGLTYGIGSSVVPLRHSGYFFISTEVNADATAQALEEIYKEIGKLRETSPDAKELERVKSYLLGAFLRSVSGPFSQLEQLRSRLFFDLPENYIESFPKRLQAVTSDQVQEMANRYWQEAHLIQVVAGP